VGRRGLRKEARLGDVHVAMRERQKTDRKQNATKLGLILPWRRSDPLDATRSQRKVEKSRDREIIMVVSLIVDRDGVGGVGEVGASTNVGRT